MKRERKRKTAITALEFASIGLAAGGGHLSMDDFAVFLDSLRPRRKRKGKRSRKAGGKAGESSTVNAKRKPEIGDRVIVSAVFFGETNGIGTVVDCRGYRRGGYVVVRYDNGGLEHSVHHSRITFLAKDMPEP